MTGVLHEINAGTDWSVITEVETPSGGGTVTKIRCYNFSSSQKTFTIDLPSISAFNVVVGAGSVGYANKSTNWPSTNLGLRLGSWGGADYWDLRLYDGDTRVDTSHVTVT